MGIASATLRHSVAILALVGSLTATQLAAAAGELRVAAQQDPDSLDPARAYTSRSWQVLANTGGGLVAFRRAAGRAGSEIVPQLAREVPTPTSGGRRLVFRLREGVRFGPPSGRRVLASDVKASIERLFRIGSPGRGLYRGIAGAARFERSGSGGITGIVADDAARTVEFRLTRSDGGILPALALPFAQIIPAEWDRQEWNRPPASIGPYYVRGYRRGAFIDLARNPYYAPTAQLPAGIPDGVRVTIGQTEREATTAIAQGRLHAAEPLTRPLDRSARAGVSVRASISPTTHVVVMNTTRAPFSRQRVRRAVTTALDRRDLAARLGKGARLTGDLIPSPLPGAGSATVPPASPGKARRILAGIPEAREPVVVWGAIDEPSPAIVRAIAADLRAAGLRATTRLVPRASLLKRLGDPAGGAQIAYVRVRNDVLDPGAYLRLALSADAASSGGSLNYSRVSSSALERLVQGAVATWGASARGAAWARVSAAARTLDLMVPFAESVRRVAVSPRLGGFVAHPLYGFLWMRARPA